MFSGEIHALLVFAPHRHVPYASVSASASGHTITSTHACLDGNRTLLAELLAEHIPAMGYRIAWLDVRELGIDGSPAEFLLEEAGVALADGLA